MGFLQLERCTGPECPRCGCKDVEVVRWPIESTGALPFIHPDPQKATAWGGGPWWNQGRARCRHCFTEFTFRELPTPPQPEAPEEPPTDFAPEPLERPLNSTPDDLPSIATPRKPTECPRCAGRFHVYKTRGSKQYRRCKDCSHRGETAAPG